MLLRVFYGRLSHFFSLSSCQHLASVLFFSIFLFGGCATLQLKPKIEVAISRPPDYEETAPYYLFGLVGKPYFDVYRICHSRSAEQIQTTYTPADFTFAAMTLFLYFPKTVRVWCKE